MKNFLLPLCFCAFSILGFAQAEMKTVWEVKLDHKTEKNELDEETGNILSSSEKEVSLVNVVTGKIKWTNDFKVLSGGLLKKVDERIPMWDAKCIFLFDRKGGRDQMAVLDVETGKMLWSNDKYEGITAGSVAYISELDMFAIASKKAFHMIKARTGEEVWETQGFKGALGKYMYNGDDKTITALNYNPAAAGESILGGLGKMFASFGAFKSQLTKFSVKNGDILWQTDIKGAVEKEIATGKIMAKLSLVNNDKLMLYLQGLQVYDFKNGSLIWGVTHDESVMEESKRGIGSGYSGSKLIKSAVYKAIAEPLIDGNDVYVFDMQTKKNQFVSKYDLNTGKLIWKSEELKKLTIAPNIYKIDNRVVIQIGGWAEVQGIVEQKSAGLSALGGASITTYKKVKFYKDFGPFGVEALDATNGQFVWRSERFAKGVTNAFVYNSDLIVASGKELYNLNPIDGKEKYETSVKEDDIKATEQIFKLGEDAIIVCSKGVSSHKCKDGAKNWVVKTKKGDLAGVYNGMAFYTTEKSDQVVIDLASGKFTTYDAKKGADTDIFNDGQFIIVYEKDIITKLKTKE